MRSEYAGWCSELNSRVKKLAEQNEVPSLRNNPEAVRILRWQCWLPAELLPAACSARPPVGRAAAEWQRVPCQGLGLAAQPL